MRKRTRDVGADPRIVITDIRDQEDNALPALAMESVAMQVLEAVADLGLKATVRTSGSPRSRAQASAPIGRGARRYGEQETGRKAG